MRRLICVMLQEPCKTKSIIMMDSPGPLGPGAVAARWSSLIRPSIIISADRGGLQEQQSTPVQGRTQFISQRMMKIGDIAKEHPNRRRRPTNGASSLSPKMHRGLLAKHPLVMAMKMTPRFSMICAETIRRFIFGENLQSTHSKFRKT